jgi:hypothetical protein
LPVNLAADRLADAAVRWFKKYRQTDDLSRLVKAAAPTSAPLKRDDIRDLRKLLEDVESWRLLAGDELKVQRLVERIAACLSRRGDRTEEASREIAGAIARGLLEFAVYDLQPEIFQKVVLTRLQRMTDQNSRISALDKALFQMHEEMYSKLCAHADEMRDMFSRVSDQLPKRASLGDIRIYLNALIEWLNTDPWPKEQPGKPLLSPAEIERKLRIRVSVAGPAGEQDADADDLARECSRLVLLGGPGSGKTWLAMRIARTAAERALAALDEGKALAEVELPLYTTCSRLASASGAIRETAAYSAVNSIGDLGGSRITTALREFFTDQGDAQILLVIDSLDEADPAGADVRLRQAAGLKPPWRRVVLTSRPSSWSNQLPIEKGNAGHRIGELQPLRYPHDVELVIERWFADTPSRGQALASQIARSPSLQRVSTVPLILAFYCILGGQQALPEFTHDLYRRVINQMLRAVWRSAGVPLQNAKNCREALRTWAWKGATRNHSVSGVAQWEDDILTAPEPLTPDEQAAADHVAVPYGFDFDTDEIRRRFVHRSIREYLVAEHVADLCPADRAARELLPHLWYDAAWRYTAPMAIAMHPERDELLRILLRDISRTGEIPGDPSADDAGNEVREVLAHLAAESREADWSTEAAMVIGQARVELARSGVFIEAAGWPISNSQIRQIAITRMAGNVDSQETAQWARILAELDPALGDKHLASEAVLRQLGTETYGWRVRDLADTLARLEPAPADKRQAREVLLAQLGASPYAPDLAAALLLLEPSPDDKRRALATMLTQLADPAYRLNNWYGAPYLMYASMPDVLMLLEPTAEDTRRARDALFERLGREHSGTMAVRLMDMLIRLDPAPQGSHQVLNAGLQLLLQFADQHLASSAGPLAEAVMGLAQSAEEKHHALDTLITYLSGQVTMTLAADLAPLSAQLDPTSKDKGRARQVLLRLLTAPREPVLYKTKSARNLVAAFLQLDPPPGDIHQARRTLLGLLSQAALEGKRKLQASDQAGPFFSFSKQNYSAVAADSAAALLQLDPPAEDKRQARSELLGLLTNQDRSGEPNDRADLAVLLGKLDPAPSDKRQAIDALLALLTHDTRGTHVKKLAGALAQLDPAPRHKHKARRVVHDLLRGQAVHRGDEIMTGLTLLGATPDELCQTRETARDALLAQIGTGDLPTFGTAAKDVSVLVRLASTPDDKRQTLDGLLGLLARETDSDVARNLIGGIAQLDPTVHDLSSCRTWATPPSRELLAAARRNSAPDEWLTIFSL